MNDLYDVAAAVPDSLRGRLSTAHREDLSRQGLTRSAIGWRAGRRGLMRVSRDAYLTGELQPDLLDRLRALLLVLPPTAVIGFHTAAALHGFGVLRSGAIHVVVPAGTAVPQRRGVVAHESVLPLGTPQHVLGIPCTRPARTAVDVARLVRRTDALPMLDAALRCGALTEDTLFSELARHRRLRGVRQVRELAVLADSRAECRQESQVRLLLHDAGVRGFVPQVTIRDSNGRPMCRLDLADETARAGLEYDGVSHYNRDRTRADRSRHNWLAAHGWAMRYFTDVDLYRRPEHLVRVAVAAQRRSRS